jgi:hypothetical protein
MKEQSKGLKYDANKLRMDLIPPSAIKSLAAVLTFGANKYQANSWQGVEANRYVAALLRHLVAYMEDPMSTDKDSGLLHIEHVLCNAAFLNEFCQRSISDKHSDTEPTVKCYPLHEVEKLLQDSVNKNILEYYTISITPKTRLRLMLVYKIKGCYSFDCFDCPIVIAEDMSSPAIKCEDMDAIISHLKKLERVYK